MNENKRTSTGYALKIWGLIGCLFPIVLAFDFGIYALILIPFYAVITIPALVVLLFRIPRIEQSIRLRKQKFFELVLTGAVCTIPYGFSGLLVFDNIKPTGYRLLDDMLQWIAGSFVLFIIVLSALLMLKLQLMSYFTDSPHVFLTNSTKHQHMETYETPQQFTTTQQTSNRILWKAAIIGVLILVMLIPTVFINNLIAERQQRQSEVVQEVTSKWAADQSLTGPYIFLNYTKSHLDEKGKKIAENKTAILLPGELSVHGKLLPEIRTRSIYNVLLYRAELLEEGIFLPGIPDGTGDGNSEITSAKLCFGLTDLKGIEEKILVNFNGKDYELLPGLPTNDLDSIGLFTNIPITNLTLNNPISFKLPVKIKGSGTLHFVPLSGNSQFYLQSSFANPSFDGNKIPDKRMVSEKGFEASWTFNKANLPFSSFFTESSFKKESLAFGVAIQQPSDQYAKTNRSIKYSILLIALCFSLFFIVELMQKKPLHPVQYCMVGIALIVFFTLLLSISEFISFEWSYLIAATATVWLVTLYAKGHFGNWKTALLFTGILSALYGFILVLISLEDTALLVGSIGLFLILGLLMYASRKINWYTSVSPGHN